MVQCQIISLLSAVYKLYTSILNNIIVTCVEETNIFCDEQMDFRQIDLVLTTYLDKHKLLEIVRTRNCQLM